MQREKRSVRRPRSPRRARHSRAAQEAVETAERDADVATRKKDAAARRVRETADALAAAKVRTEAAQAAFQTGSGRES